MPGKKKKANVTHDRLEFQALQFLKLQAETKDWIESVIDRELDGNDMHDSLKSGRVLCELLNTLFPGSIRRVHKSNFAAHQMENIGFVLSCLRKLDMQEDELFEPTDLYEMKNMMKVFKCLYSFAEKMSGKGKARKWRAQVDADFSFEEINEWKEKYGGLDMEFEPMVKEDEVVESSSSSESIEQVEDVFKADPDDFVVTDHVNLKMLGVTLAELIKAVDKVEEFEDNEPAQTADNTTDASIKAAQYAAQVKALGQQSDDAGYRSRLDKAFKKIDDANEAMVDRQNEWQGDRDNKKKGARLTDACEHLKKVAREALAEAEKMPARCAQPSDFDIDGRVTDADIEVSLAELVKACRKVQDMDGVEPTETTKRTEKASKKAARFAAQIDAVGKQSDDPKFKKRMAKHGTAIQGANEDMVAANNKYLLDPSPKNAKDLDAKVEELIRIATNAANDALAKPAACANSDDFAFDQDVTSGDLDVSLAEVIKAVRKAEELDGTPPKETTKRTEKASKKAARFGAQIRRVGDQLGDQGKPKMKKKLHEHTDKIQAANEDFVAANNKYLEKTDDSKRQTAFIEAGEELIRVCQNAHRDATRFLNTPDAIDMSAFGDINIDGVPTEDELRKQLREVIKATNKVDNFPEHSAHKTAKYATDDARKAATLAAMVKAVGKEVRDKDLSKKIVAASGDLDDANADMVGAVNVYTQDTENETAQSNLHNADDELKKVAAAAVELAVQGLESNRAPEIDSDDDNLADIDPDENPLHFATLKGNMDAVRNLIKKGLKVDAMNAQGWTPLYTAAYVGNLDLIHFFVKQGADVNVRNGEGWTPLFAAVSQGHKHVVKPLLDDYDAEYNVQADQGTTPLYHAAEGGRYTITRMLLEKGADTEMGKAGGWKPIHGAVFNYHAKVTKLLVDNGASVDPANKELKSYTPLHIAISTKKPNVDVVKLLAANAKPDAKNKNGATPLHLAAMWGHREIVECLVDNGHNLKATNNKSRTPLEVAVRNGHSKLAKWMAGEMGVRVPDLQTKKTMIAAISAPAAPPTPPEDEE